MLLCDLQIARRQKFVGLFRQPPNFINFAFEATCSDQVFRNHRFDMYFAMYPNSLPRSIPVFYHRRNNMSFQLETTSQRLRKEEKIKMFN